MSLSPLSRHPVKSPAGKRTAAFAACLALSLALAPLAYADPASVALPSFSPIVKQVMPAVVNISVTEQASAIASDDSDDQDAGPDQGFQHNFPPSPFDEFLRRFFEQHQGQGQGMPMPHGASAWRWARASSSIPPATSSPTTTSSSNADKVTVIFQDDSQHPAKVIGRDPRPISRCSRSSAKQPLPYVVLGRQRRRAGRRLGAGGRQSLRPRRHGQPRHHLGARPRHPCRPL